MCSREKITLPFCLSPACPYCHSQLFVTEGSLAAYLNTIMTVCVREPGLPISLQRPLSPRTPAPGTDGPWEREQCVSERVHLMAMMDWGRGGS